MLTVPAATSPHDALLLFNNEDLAAIRTSRWKLVIRSYYRTLDVPLARSGLPLLFDARADPAENYNLASLHPDVVESLQHEPAEARETLGAAP